MLTTENNFNSTLEKMDILTERLELMNQKIEFLKEILAEENRKLDEEEASKC